MERKLYSKLKNWKSTQNGKSAIMVDGARRVGKSYIVEEFAKKEYKSYILIDFNYADKSVIDIFERYLTDLDTFFSYLSLFYRKTLYVRESVIIFDEVQLYPKARAAIKYLVQDGRYDFIETGSLVSINKNVKDIVIPSEEYHIDMHPMDFEEFLWAIGENQMMDFIRNCFAKGMSLGPLHQRAMDYFRQYMLVGGMPQAVQEYVDKKDFVSVDFIKRNIIRLYRNDISKYATGFETKVTSIFDEIPAQLQKHERKFKLSDISDKARFREYESSFFWLNESRIVNLCFGATEPNVGLRLRMDANTLKCYMHDTGLLVSMAFDENEMVNNNLYIRLLMDKLETNSGMLVENIVAQILKANGHKLYFYSRNSDVKEDRMELDFLILKPDVSNRHNISPIEVKSSTRFSTTSLKKCIAKYKNYLGTAYVVYPGDFKVEDGITYIPMYMATCL
ncbi:MAG: AAA family ATPase [Paludibacteraceae bacterium]|nr:AAA family ATPase [Paludibacteraceae bacterium]